MTRSQLVIAGGGLTAARAIKSYREAGGEGAITLVGEEATLPYRAHGLELLLEEEVAGFAGDGVLRLVETKSGLRVEADLAVVGIGVIPNVDFLEGSGIGVDNGVVVNSRFETSAPGVYAAGDVANFFDPLYGRQRRIEHWSNASYQGTEVGRILAGAEGGYDTVSSFFSEVFGTTIKAFGDVSRFDTLTTEGSLAEGFLAAYGDRGRLVGAVTVDQSEELEALVQELIADREPADALERELVR
jgi:3-phenylpropionate/trans-cinnamate dioxygenase ferredoxin reductase component